MPREAHSGTAWHGNSGVPESTEGEIFYLTDFIRGVTPLFVIRLLRKLERVLDPHGRLSYGQEGEDLVLLRLFDRRESGFFVDVGAHHPVRFSNTWVFYQRGWRGINIEPNPQAMELFKQWRPGDINLAIGIDEHSTTQRYFEFDDPALNTYDEAVAVQRQHTDGYRLIRSTMQELRRLDEVLAEHLPAGQKIDFLSVDAEGLDFQVISSNDWSRFRPACVLIEVLRSTLENLGANETHQYVTQQGYVLFAKTGNTCVYLDRKLWPDLH